jgi:hypothetical protein
MTSLDAVQPMIRLPWGTTPEGELNRQGTIVGSIMGTYAVFLTLPLGILGIVLSCMGLDRIPRGNPSGRTLLMWSWICFAPGTVVGLPLTLLLIVGLVRSIG